MANKKENIEEVTTTDEIKTTDEIITTENVTTDIKDDLKPEIKEKNIYKFNKNVCWNRTIFVAGQEIELTEMQLKELQNHVELV